jgi:hypothetical protein
MYYLSAPNAKILIVSLERIFRTEEEPPLSDFPRFLDISVSIICKLPSITLDVHSIEFEVYNSSRI